MKTSKAPHRRNKSSPTVSVVTVTYANRASLARQVVAGAISSGASTIIVVDNASVEPSTSELSSLESPEGADVELIRLDTNLGSAGGYATGLEAAEALGHDFFWLLDDDNLPCPGALDALLDAADRYPGAALLSLRLDRDEFVRYATGERRDACFPEPNAFLGFSIARALRKRLRPRAPGTARDPAEPLEVPYAPYGGLFLRREHVERIGLPRHDFYLYADDHEYSTRLAKLGIQIVLVPDSEIRDLERSWYRTSDGDAPDSFVTPHVLLAADPGTRGRMYYSVRNRAYLEMHHWSTRRSSYALNLATYSLAVLMLSLVASVVKRTPAPLLGVSAYFQGIFDALRGRLGRVHDR